jgi:hypothetical protein
MIRLMLNAGRFDRVHPQDGRLGMRAGWENLCHDVQAPYSGERRRDHPHAIVFNRLNTQWSTRIKDLLSFPAIQGFPRCPAGLPHPGSGWPGGRRFRPADRLDLIGAVWSPHSVNKTLQIHGFDANFGATYTVFATTTGTKLGTFTESSAWQDGGIQNNLRVPPGPTTFTSFTNPGSITVTDSLGGSATIPVTVNLKYS